MVLKDRFKNFIGILIKPRSIGLVALIIVSLLSINFIFFSILAPVKAYRELNQSVENNSNRDKKPALSNKEINFLIKEKAFYEAKLKAAKSDSLVLSLNFPDSLLNIEIKGVPIHTLKLKKFDLPNFYSMVENNAFSQIFSEPQHIVQHYATSKKEPIKIVNAPKDTAEFNASSTNTNYDTSTVRLTFVQYETNKGFRIVFIPVEDKNFQNWITAFKFDTKLTFRNFIRGFRSSLQMEIPDFNPTAEIFMSHDDILSIHRALPEHAEVCIHY